MAKDIFFPTPYQFVIVWHDGYWMGKIQGPPREVVPLPLERRLAHLRGVPIRWRVGAREGLAIWNWEGAFLIPRSTRVQVERELLLPGGLKIQEEKNRLVLTGPGIPGEKQVLPQNRLGQYLERVVLAIRADPPAVWAAGLYCSGPYSSFAVRAVHPGGMLDLNIPLPAINACMEVAPGFLAILGGKQLWAGGMDQNSLALLLEGELIGLGFSPRGRWLVALREDSSLFVWRWAREAFRLVRHEEIAGLPEKSHPNSIWSIRIAPSLKWAICVDYGVWAIPLPSPLPPPKEGGEPRETLRRILL